MAVIVRIALPRVLILHAMKNKGIAMSTFVCAKCHTEYPIDRPLWQCPCGGLLDIDIKADLPIDLLKQRPPTMWRYREMLPIIEDANIVSYDEGFTPLIRMSFARHTVFIKQDYLFPTGSFKDRGAALLISKIKELGIDRVIEDSSGNAGAAIAAYSARAGIACDIYVPENASQDKIAQIKAYGAQVHVIQGSREDVAQKTLRQAARTYYASHCWNPLFMHGTKTFAYEVCEQLDWYAPHTLVVPVGGGTLLLGAYIGFTEMLSAGLTNRLPRIIAVQAERCAPLAHAFNKGEHIPGDVVYFDTIAKGIAISNPIRRSQILTAVQMSDGCFITVTDAEIIQALKDLCAHGFYVEPTAAATIAGLKRYLETASPNEMIVSTLTGHGLKTSNLIQELLQ
jgi:threonine synthase